MYHQYDDVQYDLEEQSTKVAFADIITPARTILTTDYPEPLWILDEMIVSGLTILGGLPKCGKSYFSIGLAIAMTGDNTTYLDRAVAKGHVLYFGLEDIDRLLKQRLQTAMYDENAEYDLDFVLPFAFNEYFDGSLTSEKGWERFVEGVTSKDYKLVVIDTISRATDTDQMEKKDIEDAYRKFWRFASDHNICIIFVDHHNKMSLNTELSSLVGDVFGSIGKAGAVDTIVGMYGQPDDDELALKWTGRQVRPDSMSIKRSPITELWIAAEGRADLSKMQNWCYEQVERNPGITAQELQPIADKNDGPADVGRSMRECVDKGVLMRKGRPYKHYTIAEYKTEVLVE